LPTEQALNANNNARTKYNLVTIKNIKAWEELTVKYTFYNMGSNGKNLSVSEKLQNELEPIVNAPMMETE